ncbi:hypothetical protein GLE_3840 [Lysobacter enzymogenes]|uniref:Uncharacterized protein n=1 Tax=Lysobacter enzymogenes TaxID=69 RepID=A0A0S2DLJ9_LYSEN|nr:hypothetical protein GLE_3840 [Lysobacter enzymogenes]
MEAHWETLHGPVRCGQRRGGVPESCLDAACALASAVRRAMAALS